MIKAYETPNGGKLLHDPSTGSTFAIVDLAPALENYIFPTTVTWSGTDNFDVWTQFNQREPKDVDIIAMLSNIVSANTDKKQVVIAKYFIDALNAQDWTEF